MSMKEKSQKQYETEERKMREMTTEELLVIARRQHCKHSGSCRESDLHGERCKNQCEFREPYDIYCPHCGAYLGNGYDLVPALECDCEGEG